MQQLIYAAPSTPSDLFPKRHRTQARLNPRKTALENAEIQMYLHRLSIVSEYNHKVLIDDATTGHLATF